MSAMESIHREVAAGRAMLRAGNTAAAIRHCKAALEVDPDHDAAYDLQYDILLERNRPEEALRVTRARLERDPTSPDATLNEISLLASLMRAGLAKQAVQRAEIAFADDPMMQHDIHLIYDWQLGRTGALKKHLKRLRAIDYSGRYDLDSLERFILRKSGNLKKIDRMLADDLADGRIEAGKLEERAVIALKSFRLGAARRYAEQAKALRPQQAPVYDEIRNAARIGSIPLLWPAHVFALISEFIGSRMPVGTRVFAFVIGIFVTIMMIVFTALPLMLWADLQFDLNDDSPWLMVPLASFIFLNMGWAGYLEYGVGEFSYWRLRERRVSIDPDY